MSEVLYLWDKQTDQMTRYECGSLRERINILMEWGEDAAGMSLSLATTSWANPKVVISTVFIPCLPRGLLSDEWGMFETMVFGGCQDGNILRSKTPKAARAIHESFCGLEQVYRQSGGCCDCTKQCNYPLPKQRPARN